MKKTEKFQLSHKEKRVFLYLANMTRNGSTSIEVSELGKNIHERIVSTLHHMDSQIPAADQYNLIKEL